MRAREFVVNVNVPVTIKINGDGDPEISVQNDQESQEIENPVMAPPLQQKIELMKHAAGKQSKVIDQIIADDDNEAS